MQVIRSFSKTHSLQRVLLIISFFCVLGLQATKPQRPAVSDTQKTLVPYPHVEIVTDLGKIYLELDGIRAPITTQNFLDYVGSGHYNGTIFHRVIPGFMAQAGGYDENYMERETLAPIYNESGNGLSNLTGTIAMARTNDPHSATSQFFINVVDNEKLNPNPSRWGYTVFGEVLYGMPLVQKIVKVPTRAAGQFRKDVPVKPIIIETMRVMAADEEIPQEVFSPDDFIDEGSSPAENTENTADADKTESVQEDSE